MKEFKIKSDLAEVEKLRSFLRESLQELNLSEKAYFIIELSLLEICINIINYAYPQKKGDLFLKTWKEKDRLYFEVRDYGLPFDPTQSKTPDIEEMVKNEKKGGLGIFLVRKLMDGIDYRRVNDQNILTMYKKVKGIKTKKSV